MIGRAAEWGGAAGAAEATVEAGVAGARTPREGGDVMKAARAFEEILVQSLIQSMRQTLPGENGGIFGSGPGAGIYEGFFDQGVSQAIAPKLGLGLRDALVRQLTPKAKAESASSGLSHPASHTEGSNPAQITLSPQVPRVSAESRGIGVPTEPPRRRE
ncbi:MAG: rod-binding protein [Acidobacteria bacterium]|nr:rod-binding protein [Acidobacteriota bacterium]